MSFKMFTVLLLFGLAHARYFIIGPASVKMVSIKECPEYVNKKLPMILDFKPHMYNSSLQLVDVTLVVPFDLGQNVTLNVRTQKIDKTKPQSNAFSLNDVEACSAIPKYVGNLWFYIRKELGLELDVCPIKKGNYHAKNLYVDLSKMKVQMFFEGLFRSRIIFNNFTTPIYCKEFELLLKPKMN